MSDPRIAHRRLVEHALANVRQVPLAMLLELLAPVQRVTGYDTVMPLSRLEYQYLPSVERIVAAARKTLEAS